MRFRIRRGLDVAIPGAPRQEIGAAAPVSSVAVLGPDHRLHRPDVLVAPGDRVRLGQPLVTDRRNPGIVVTSPGAGVVTEVERGERRSLRAVLVRLEGADAVTSERVDRARLVTMTRAELARTLCAGGLWPALRERPFHRVPFPDRPPDALFVTAIDTNPLAARPEVVIGPRREDFEHGLAVLGRLLDGPLFLCVRAGSDLPRGDPSRVTDVEVAGPHPAGLPGTHIDLVHPVRPGRRVWHVGYQDVLAIGRQLATGRPDVERVVALGGPLVKDPRLVRTRLGASIPDLVQGELRDGGGRLISGSVLSGRQASGWGRHLGRHHVQVAVIPEPGEEPNARRRWTTSRHGATGPFRPTEEFERVMPLGLLPSPLLRALLVGDDDAARELGCLGLDEEDLALCTYVCPAKIEYGPLLSRTLERLESVA